MVTSCEQYFENDADFVDVNPLRLQQFRQDVTYFNVGNILHVSDSVGIRQPPHLLMELQKD